MGERKVRGGELYLVLSVALMGFYLAQAWSAHWESDFFEHAAVVRELAAHPFAPLHPALGVAAPHAFFSPYALGWGLIARETGSGAIPTLVVAGFFNLALWLASLWLFARRFAGNGFTAFYLLLCTLFLWGVLPWKWGGFFHLREIAHGAAYPSTFCFALVLLSFVLCLNIARTGRLGIAPVVGVIAATVLITHPVTAFFMYAGMVAFAIDAPKANRRAVLVTALAVVALSLLALVFWPYYSLAELFRDYAAGYDELCEPLYESALLQMFPALLGLPPVLLRFRQNRRDPLALTLVALLAGYLYGMVSGAYSWGRTISPAVFVLHLALAAWAGANYPLDRWRTWPKVAYKGLLFGGTLLIGAQSLYPVGELLLKESVAEKYAPLARLTGQYDVILSDMEIDMVIPALGGKTVTTGRPAPFVLDYPQREADEARFFDPAISPEERGAIVRRYGVRFLLLVRDTGEYPLSLLGDLTAMGTVRHREPNFLLIERDDRSAPPGQEETGAGSGSDGRSPASPGRTPPHIAQGTSADPTAMLQPRTPTPSAVVTPAVPSYFP